MKAKPQTSVIHRVTRYDGSIGESVNDVLVVEEPLEIRVAGESVAVTMRTPGADRALALGFLYGEGIIHKIGDVGRAEHCGRPGTPEYGNVIDVLPRPGEILDPERIRAGRRGTLTSSACGVCGREQIEDMMQRCQPIDDSRAVQAAMIFFAQEQMRQSQDVFAQTGGVHAAAAFSETGDMYCCFEDIGRHNAVDKVVGHLLETHNIVEGEGVQILAVSSRASFEIVQKAVVARIPVVVAVSAASSLAADLAQAMGITLIGFARDKRMVVYTGAVQ
ncbi:MAG: formate dehydrogenase accessory sulfurtransferase FdhD [Gemmatimonadetes bacterium]|nr:formate dehydrogenase accessory sulfurtransferase FdhD [Gemmatimonadota bacterium]